MWQPIRWSTIPFLASRAQVFARYKDHDTNAVQPPTSGISPILALAKPNVFWATGPVLLGESRGSG